MKTIALINQKGGVGKTTTTVNIGAGLARAGRSVLLVDLDPQAHLTYSFGIQAHEKTSTILEVLEGLAPPGQAAQALTERFKPGSLSVIPANLNLAGAELELAGIPGRELLLRASLQDVAGDFDYCLIDCPPQLSLLTFNAMVAVEEIWVPIQTEFLALQGTSMLLQTVKKIQQRLNSAIRVGGVVLTMYDARTNLSDEVVQTIRLNFGKAVFKTVIRQNVSLAEAPSHGKTIFEYAPESAGARDYAALTEEVLAREREAVHG